MDQRDRFLVFDTKSEPVLHGNAEQAPDGVEGHNMLPGGQSALPLSPHFADQAAQWLENRTTPMRYTPEEGAAGAVSRERFVPAPAE